MAGYFHATLCKVVRDYKMRLNLKLSCEYCSSAVSNIQSVLTDGCWSFLFEGLQTSHFFKALFPNCILMQTLKKNTRLPSTAVSSFLFTLQNVNVSAPWWKKHTERSWFIFVWWCLSSLFLSLDFCNFLEVKLHDLKWWKSEDVLRVCHWLFTINLKMICFSIPMFRFRISSRKH